MNAVVAVLILGFLSAALFLLWQVLKRQEAVQAQSGSLSLFQQQIEALRSEIATQLSQVNQSVVQSQGALGERLDRAAKVVGDVQHKLGSLGEATERVLSLGKDMGREISELQQVFKPPKMRGGVGEVLLANLLEDILPSERYALQHAFKSRDIVDAVIKLPEGMVPVDAKFPLENFKRIADSADDGARKSARREFIRDVKKHVDDISRKYILPDEGTLDFALMYVPAENVFYEAVLRDEDGELYRHAMERKVVPVSPNSFYAYLMALVRGFRGMKVAAQAREILESLDRLHGDLKRFSEDFALTGKHLSNAQKAFGEAEKRLVRFDDKLSGLRGLEAGPERPALDSQVKA